MSPAVLRLRARLVPARLLPAGLACALLATAPAAWAQYKVIDANGRVTYTDQPPAASTQGQPLRSGAAPAPAGPSTAGLPFELRTATTRYPVTLYSASGCRPCDAGRELLQKRGVPFTEKRVDTPADVRAFQQISAERSLPLLTIGSQQLKGLVAADWQGYLDAAGYPRESRLPATYRAPAATPLAPPAPPAAPASEPESPRPSAPPPPAPRRPDEPNIRF